MERGYKRCTDRGNFDENDMKKAVSLVIDENYSYQAAAAQFSLSQKTLWR